MQDINDQFHGFRDKFGFSDSTPLVKVGGLTIEERVYEDEVCAKFPTLKSAKTI
jgi:hypothetical protein